ncbi:MAG: YihY/virulence factor BrkB family protein [Lactobacillales bacterium]|nr:YihY/virulence factor BrkB family protein [Lactobacillales bacterium]
MIKKLQKVLNHPKCKRFFAIIRAHFSFADIGMTSIVSAYYFLLSLFPLLIAAGNILPYLNIDPAFVLTYLKQMLPKDVFNILKSIIQDLLTKRSTSLLSISAIITLWSASRGINALQQGINRTYGINKQHNLVINRLVSFFVMLLLIVVLVIAMAVINFGQNIINYLQTKFAIDISFLNNIHSWIIILSIIIIFLLLAIMYYAVSNIVIPRKRYLLPGAVFASLSLFILSHAFGLYAKYFITKINEYRWLASFVVLMFWLVFLARIIILGSMINSILMEYFTGAKPVIRDQQLYLWMKSKKEKLELKRKNNEKK